MRHAVYRVFGPGNELLYVGRSLDPVRRLRDHSVTATWFDQVRSVTVEWFDTFAMASRIEAAAILLEQPLFNKRGTREEAMLSDGILPRTPRQARLAAADVASKDVAPAIFFCLETHDQIVREAARLRQRKKRAKDRQQVKRHPKSDNKCAAIIDLARQYGVSSMTIRRWMRAGRIGPVSPQDCTA